MFEYLLMSSSGCAEFRCRLEMIWFNSCDRNETPQEKTCFFHILLLCYKQDQKVVLYLPGRMMPSYWKEIKRQMSVCERHLGTSKQHIKKWWTTGHQDTSLTAAAAHTRLPSAGTSAWPPLCGCGVWNRCGPFSASCRRCWSRVCPEPEHNNPKSQRTIPNVTENAGHPDTSFCFRTLKIPVDWYCP